MPAGDESDRQQQAKVRLECQDTKQDAGKERAARKLEQSPAKQARRQEGGLAMGKSPKHGGKGEADPQCQRLREDPPQCHQISGKPEGKPSRERLQIGQLCQRVCDEEGGGRIVPGIKIWCRWLCDSPFQCKKRVTSVNRP